LKTTGGQGWRRRTALEVEDDRWMKMETRVALAIEDNERGAMETRASLQVEDYRVMRHRGSNGDAATPYPRLIHLFLRGKKYERLIS
jgi:hypothetical protein